MTSKKAAIVAFLNTALGIWLLSSVAVGMVSTRYSSLNAHLTDLSKKNTQFVRLHIKILQRMAQLSGQIDQIDDAPGFDINQPNDRAAAAVKSFLVPPAVSAQSEYPVYPAFDEYKERPIVITAG